MNTRWSSDLLFSPWKSVQHTERGEKTEAHWPTCQHAVMEEQHSVCVWVWCIIIHSTYTKIVNNSNDEGREERVFMRGRKKERKRFWSLVGQNKMFEVWKPPWISPAPCPVNYLLSHWDILISNNNNISVLSSHLSSVHPLHLLSSQLQRAFNYSAGDFWPQLLTISITQQVNTFCKLNNPKWACKREVQQSTMWGFVFSPLLFLPHSLSLSSSLVLRCRASCSVPLRAPLQYVFISILHGM